MKNNTKDNVKNDSASTFNIYNRRSVDALIKKNPDILKYVNKDEDYSYNKDKINNVITQSIMSGISLDKITERITQVTGMDENGAKRTARTAMTAAENLGRNEGYHDLKEKGIPCRFQWSATHDSHTRDTHILLDGTYQNDDGYFGEGIIETLIEFPGDPAGDPEEIYNCRCRASLVLKGIDHSQDDELYEQFMKENFPDDWESIEKGIKEKESAYKVKASGAAERVKDNNQNKPQDERSPLEKAYDNVNNPIIEGKIAEGEEQKAAEAINGMGDVLRDFDMTEEGVRRIYFSDDAKANASMNGVGDLTISNKKLKDEGKVKEGYFTNDTWYGTGAHEAGHRVCDLLMERNMKEAGASHLEMANARHDHKIESQIIKEAKRRYGSNPPISEYGSTSVAEKVAEAVCDVYANGDKANEYSKVIVDVMKDIKDGNFVPKIRKRQY